MAFPPSHAAPAPPPRAGAEPASVGVAYYRTGHELRFYLRALRRVRVGRLVVVLGLQGPDQPPPVEEAAGVRIVHTAHGTDPGSGGVVGWFVPDPVEAVVLAMSEATPVPVPGDLVRGAETRTLYVSSRVGNLPPGYPRRPGMARKRPLRAST